MPDRAQPGGRRERIALVLAGGGARGAYELGALAALAPALAERGETPDILVGTSIGALNCAFLAARADEPLEAACAAGLRMWRELGWADALRPLLSSSELRRVLGAAAMFAGLPGAGQPALLDPSPLRHTLGRLVSFKRLARNVESGALTAAAVVATAYATQRSVVFHHGGPPRRPDPMRPIDYFATPIAPEHVLASAAIPAAFPAVEIRRPRAAAGWYSDGGVRLNAPLVPALALGADRVVVIGLNASASAARTSPRPDVIDGVAQLLQVALADQLADDVATLATVNETLAPRTAATSRDGAAGRADRRRIPYIFVAPGDRLEIGRLARDVYRRRYAGIAGLVRDPNLGLVGRIVNAQHSAIHGDVLSYLFLAREFVEELIALGRRDAERWLDSQHEAGLWQIGRLPAGGAPARRSPPRARRPRTATP